MVPVCVTACVLWLGNISSSKRLHQHCVVNFLFIKLHFEDLFQMLLASKMCKKGLRSSHVRVAVFAVPRTWRRVSIFACDVLNPWCSFFNILQLLQHCPRGLQHSP